MITPREPEKSTTCSSVRFYTRCRMPVLDTKVALAEKTIRGAILPLTKMIRAKEQVPPFHEFEGLGPDANEVPKPRFELRILTPTDTRLLAIIAGTSESVFQ